ncbi:hypothetical protein [Levilactobacillus brevis]|uniref:hypothetical protein n=1 Tax=Levilactobacillus brevis TaxID=1580 RepID=UPI002012FF4F|nr:hypothetical protein [Levilactobacillus brevis]
MSQYHKTGLLLRLNCRRDRWRIVIWIVVLAALMASVAAKFDGIYGTPHEIEAIRQTLASSGIVAMFGAFHFTGRVTTAEIFANEMLLFMALIQVIMNLTLSIHATRSDEDQGVTELIRAHTVGALAPLAAAMGELVIINGGLSVLYGLGLQLAHMPGATTSGNWLIGLGLGTTGLLFGTVGVLTAQLADHAASATGLAYGLFGIGYLARMITDVRHPQSTWWSPLGWIEKLSPYQQPNWTPVGLSLLLTFVVLGCAVFCQCTPGLRRWRFDHSTGTSNGFSVVTGSALPHLAPTTQYFYWLVIGNYPLWGGIWYRLQYNR